jgi:hypothetical protein
MSLKRRLESLEEHHRVQLAPAKWEAWDELVKRITTEELKWLTEPCDKAQSLVPCPQSRWSPAVAGAMNGGGGALRHTRSW